MLTSATLVQGSNLFFTILFTYSLRSKFAFLDILAMQILHCLLNVLLLELKMFRCVPALYCLAKSFPDSELWEGGGGGSAPRETYWVHVSLCTTAIILKILALISYINWMFRETTSLYATTR